MSFGYNFGNVPSESSINARFYKGSVTAIVRLGKSHFYQGMIMFCSTAHVLRRMLINIMVFNVF